MTTQRDLVLLYVKIIQRWIQVGAEAAPKLMRLCSDQAWAKATLSRITEQVNSSEIQK